MTRPFSLLAASFVIATTTVTATACAATPQPDSASSQTPAPAPTSPTPTPSVTESAQPVGDPTCDTIIPTSTVEDFDSVGWTVRAEPFRFGPTEVAGGVQCIWGDFTVATDHVQIFGWAPITAKEAEAAQDELVASGWRLEDAPNGVIVTESADSTVTADAEGYGLTYLFGDGWVKYADTKQGLLLVVLPVVG